MKPTTTYRHCQNLTSTENEEELNHNPSEHERSDFEGHEHRGVRDETVTPLTHHGIQLRVVGLSDAQEVGGVHHLN